MNFKYMEWDDRFERSSGKSPFDTLWDLFQELLTISGGDVEQALRWLTELDSEYNISDQFEEEYSIGEFVEDMKDRGYVEMDEDQMILIPTAKTERSIRKKALDEIFNQLRKGGKGEHPSPYTGSGLERQPETRNYNPGDDISQIDSSGTMMNMLKHSSLDKFDLQEEDLEVYNTDHYTAASTVLLIDLSHSMILYGEDRITPAKKVAMALSELIMNNYANDSLDIVAFGNEAWQIAVKDLPYLKVGPYHTNTLHALQVSRHLLQRKKYSNKQIFMITDGKPSCMFENGKLYKNSFGLDRKIVNRVMDEAVNCRRNQIDITTFMIARDPYLQNFVKQLTQANKGRAYFASLNNLGEFIFHDYVRNRIRNVR
ncbi:MAG: hypothetical protein WDZ36_01605 [Balneolaceae bacterium]